MTPTIGLFGTCGASHWRAPFVAEYQRRGITFFNPQVPNWTPARADVEAHHLAHDDIVLFAVTGESSSIGSLAEVGFVVLSVVLAAPRRHVVVHIEPAVGSSLAARDPSGAEESNRARQLVRAHLRQQAATNARIVGSLAEMLDMSLALHSACGSHKGCG